MSRFLSRAVAATFVISLAAIVATHPAVAESLAPQAGERALLLRVPTHYFGLDSYNGGIGLRQFLSPTTALRPAITFRYSSDKEGPSRSTSYDARQQRYAARDVS